MTAPATTSALPARAVSALTSTIGLKVVMAISGVVLLGFVIGHMVGNLQVFLPRGADGRWALDVYGESLRAIGHGAGLWVARIGLLAALVAHVGAAVVLAKRNSAARPVRYRGLEHRASTYASRTMLVSGPLIALFALYHLMHLTWGNAHPDFHPGRIHANVLVGLAQPLAFAVYVAAMLLLGAHLHHGVWSLLQTLGLAHPRWNALRRTISAGVAALVVVGNLSIPIAALAGWLPR